MTGGETVKAPSVSSVKTYIDALDVELQDQIDDANAAITDLQSDVTDLQAKVFNKEVKTLSGTDISNGYVTLVSKSSPTACSFTPMPCSSANPKTTACLLSVALRE